MATLAAKRSYLGHIYLDWAKFPVVEEVGRQQAPAAEQEAGAAADTNETTDAPAGEQTPESDASKEG